MDALCYKLATGIGQTMLTTLAKRRSTCHGKKKQKNWLSSVWDKVPERGINTIIFEDSQIPFQTG